MAEEPARIRGGGGGCIQMDYGPIRHFQNGRPIRDQWGLCKYVIVHTIWGGSPVILWISLGGKPKWLPLKLGYHDVMHTSPICMPVGSSSSIYKIAYYWPLGECMWSNGGRVLLTCGSGITYNPRSAGQKHPTPI